MAVWLKNFQSRVPIREALLKMQSCFLLNAIGCARYDVSIVCTTDEEVQHLNNVYRNINRPTDILSFPYHEDLTPGVLPTPLRECDYNLGDIILAIPYINSQCTQEKIDLYHRLPALVTHGLCHLIGYDHTNVIQTRQMFDKETVLLRAFNNAFGTRLTSLLTVE